LTRNKGTVGGPVLEPLLTDVKQVSEALIVIASSWWATAGVSSSKDKHSL